MARDHGFHPVRIKRIIRENADTRTYVLDADFAYEAGQFMTFKACGTFRSYSMSSAPTTDTELMTTVKRVPGGLVSTWMHENLQPGDVLEATLPSGTFCLRETVGPVVAFCGGSGVTPVLSLAKAALATTDRDVRVFAADRDADSVIFGEALARLADENPDRFALVRHLDTDGGLVTAPEVREFLGGRAEGDFYLCGPAPFMDLIEQTLLAEGVDAGQLFVERFNPAADDPVPVPVEPAVEAEAAAEVGTIEIVLNGKKKTVSQHPGETLLQSARRAGLSPPFSCEAGNCATCIAQITDGKATMRVNNALEDDEVEEGLILTCQGEPASPHVRVVYED